MQGDLPPLPQHLPRSSAGRKPVAGLTDDSGMGSKLSKLKNEHKKKTAGNSDNDGSKGNAQNRLPTPEYLKTDRQPLPPKVLSPASPETPPNDNATPRIPPRSESRDQNSSRGSDGKHHPFLAPFGRANTCKRTIGDATRMGTETLISYYGPMLTFFLEQSPPSSPARRPPRHICQPQTPLSTTPIRESRVIHSPSPLKLRLCDRHNLKNPSPQASSPFNLDAPHPAKQPRLLFYLLLAAFLLAYAFRHYQPFFHPGPSYQVLNWISHISSVTKIIKTCGLRRMIDVQLLVWCAKGKTPNKGGDVHGVV